jgi:hypothetical protein
MNHSALTYKRALQLFILLLSVPLNIFPQTDSVITNDNNDRLSRYRLSLGTVNLLMADDNYEFRHFFFNVSFRSSGFNKDLSSFKIKFAFEPGVNGLIVAQKNANNEMTYDLFLVPYAKFGPEANIVKNLHLGLSLGLVLGSYKSTFFPLPFAGINCFYLLEIKNNLYLEFETGFHTSFSRGTLPYLVYLTVGISII